jgi:TonB family protein
LETIRRLVARGVITVLLVLSMFSICSSAPCLAQDVTGRKVKTRVNPTYPEMARHFGISGTVKLAVVVAPNGTVKTTKAVGGHPLLVNAAMDAVKKWTFEPAGAESTGTVEIKFAAENN